MNNQKFYFGEDALENLQRELHILAPKKLFLLRGKGSYGVCGAKVALDKVFTIEHIEAIEWSDFEENPKIEDVINGVELLRKSKASVIIACGGGSVMDMAKLVRFYNSYDGELTDSSFEKKSDLVPLFALPTTSGTGCEATPFAVCYKDNKKYSVAHEDMLPDFAVVYPPFTYGISSYLTACTGFDALAQAIEAFWNKNHTKISDGYAEKAINLLWHSLPSVIITPTNSLRDKISEGANYAGKAIAITKTTAPHAFSYAFTTHCGYPHGHAVALTFPFFFELNAPTRPRLFEMMGIEPMNSLNTMQTYVECLGLVCKGYNNLSLSSLLSEVNFQRLSNNPINITDKHIELLENYLETL